MIKKIDIVILISIVYILFIFCNRENSMVFGSSENVDIMYENRGGGRITNNFSSYLEAYFENLNLNYGENKKNSCGYTALEIILNYYDNCYNSAIVEKKYEQAVYPTLVDKYPIFLESPGSKVNDFDSSVLSEYITNLKETKDIFLQSKLLYYAYQFGYFNEEGFKSNPNMVADVVTKYINDKGLKEMCSINSSFSANVNNRKSDCKYNMNYVCNRVEQGFPIIVFMSVLAGHAAVAYKYDKETNALYLHYGYKSDQRIYFYVAKEATESLVYGFVDLDFIKTNNINHNYIVYNNDEEIHYSYDSPSINVIHNHSFDSSYKSINNSEHWSYCKCGSRICKEHEFDNLIFIDNAYYDECKYCGALKKKKNSVINPL